MPYLTADFGIEPYNSTLSPRYKPRTPYSLTVFVTQFTGPEYLKDKNQFTFISQKKRREGRGGGITKIFDIYKVLSFNKENSV